MRLENLPLALQAIGPEEISIGQALIADALDYGFEATINLATIERYAHELPHDCK